MSDLISDVCSSYLVFLDELREGPCHALAVAAAVVEERDQGDGALGVADHRIARVGGELAGQRGDGFRLAPGLGGLLLLLVAPQRLHQHLRMLEEEIGRASCRERVCQYV